MKLELEHADTCLPGYWSGHHLPHIAIPVWRGMTLKQLKQDLRSELSQGAVMGSDENARLLSADMVQPDEEKQADRITRAAYAAVNRLKPTKPGTRRLFLDLDEGTDDDHWTEYPHAFFVFVEA